MSDVIIAGIGQTDVGEHYSISLRELAFKALEAAIHDASGLRPDILLLTCVLTTPPGSPGALISIMADWEASKPDHRGGGASVSSAGMGYLAVKSGE
jgi:acetyl-CoA acetyltransferase